MEKVTEELPDKRYFFWPFSQLEGRHFAESFIAPDFFFFFDISVCDKVS